MLTTITKSTEAKIIFSGHGSDDQELFSKIYDNYSPALLGLIFKWVKNIQTAELLLGCAFLQAWQNRKRFNVEKETLFCWLCRLARICHDENSVTEFYEKA